MKPIRSFVTLTLLMVTGGLVASSIPASAISLAPATPNRPAQPAAPTIKPPPLSHRTVWEHGRTLKKDTDWVESSFEVNKEGNRLIMDVAGNLEIQSAQVQFDDGQVQTIEPRRQGYGNGQYLLLDFGTTRRVQSVQLTGRTDSQREAAFSVHLIT
jgi:hypothetical protein